MLLSLSLIVIYLFSFWASWKHTSLCYSKGGIYEVLTPKFEDFILVIFPLANTVNALYLWMLIGPKQNKETKLNEKKDTFLNKFFKVKK